ncbi:MAG: flagellar basal body rod protein FlgB [Micavibrio sp.]|nr:flagellar basal body rod protein FlgB [Micavibrio sp.]
MAQNLTLLKAIGAKMDYLTQRQRIISQNISNADTPNYKPRDLVKADFSTLLKDLDKKPGEMKSVYMDNTKQGHLYSPSDARDPRDEKSKKVYEAAPAGNAVVMEEQLINSGQVMMDYNMMLNLMQKNTGFIKTAIGKGA